MISYFVKFPSTPHLALLDGASVRNDKVLDAFEQSEFLSHEIVVEEKLDGSNLGISFDYQGNIKAQSRGSYLPLPSPGQWSPLNDWITIRHEQLFDTLTDQYILFGEWCYATHSVNYDLLPDWFAGFDIYDLSTQRFLSHQRRNSLFAQLNIHAAPFVARGQFTIAEAKNLLKESRFGIEPAEGLYLRCDSGDWLGGRAKLVRASFIQTIDLHWSRRPLCFNTLLNKV